MRKIPKQVNLSEAEAKALSVMADVYAEDGVSESMILRKAFRQFAHTVQGRNWISFDLNVYKEFFGEDYYD
jgi:hypothetical protein